MKWRRRTGIRRTHSMVMAVIWLAIALPGGGHAAEPVNTQGPLSIQSEGSFFVGGLPRVTGGLNGATSGSGIESEGTITTGQMYVQYQVPVAAQHLPLVMIPGGGLSSQAYETTPDGRMGWSEYALRSGRPVYLVDPVGRGRSGVDATSYNLSRLGSRPASSQPPVQIIDHELAWTWFRIGPKFGTPFLDTQFPLEAVDNFYKMWLPDFNAAVSAPNPSFADLAALGDRLGGAVMLGHSQSFMFPERTALLDLHAVKGIISLESGYACDVPFTEAGAPQAREDPHPDRVCRPSGGRPRAIRLALDGLDGEVP